MDTVRAARAHIIWTSIALLLILIASCLTYVFLSKQVPECPKMCTLNVNAIESMLRPSASRKNWLLKAYNQIDDRLLWEDEWAHHGSQDEILDHNNTWIVIPEKGVYLVYIQANFVLNPQNSSSSTVDLKLLVEFNYGKKELFSAAQDSRVVKDSTSPDAMLSTFLLMYMEPANKLSVKAFPSDMVNYVPRPLSTFITIIKWADSPSVEYGR